MQIDRETLQKIAHLARLNLAPADEQKMLASLNNIIAWVDKLAEVDTNGVEPLTHATLETDTWRPDVIGEPLPRARALASAPDHDEVFFRVPRVIE
ncbi:MAG: Asp-tRNA(Asn)/Glu-tRNA(Gln) amidotransferase subunit GatC [Bernardetiaceae bacterium]|jgi:aspartyl-tRNA(Asn)/glutamyl-tRNA(Gln) amidotransferase subunit C|nr:Asp-tRNA(Asn)/Glu-tRNA(Gln) amidotransferase subunit GatC [Bernardetiaceae bacterium]